jgi:hypothetical protein
VTGAFDGAQVQPVPQVTVGQILRALRLDYMAKVGLAVLEDFGQGMDLGQMLDRIRGMRVRQPDPVDGSEAGVAVERDPDVEEVDLLAERAFNGRPSRLRRSVPLAPAR